MSIDDYLNGNAPDAIDRYLTGTKRQTARQQRNQQALEQQVDFVNYRAPTHVQNEAYKQISTAQDMANLLGRGSIAAAQGIVGLADMGINAAVDNPLAHLGRAAANAALGNGFQAEEAYQSGQLGKAIEDMGIDLKGASDYYSNNLSPEYQKLQATHNKVAEEEGFWSGAKYVLTNPLLTAGTIVESVPSIVGAGVVAKGLNAGIRAVNTLRTANTARSVGQASAAAANGARGAGMAAPVVGGFVGEGAIMAGSAHEGMRSETADGLLNQTQAEGALGIGALGAAIGAVGGRVNRKLGGQDIDDLAAGIANRTTGGSAARSLLVSPAIEAAEEVLQSGMETMITNAAMERPIDHNLNTATSLGLVSGGAMGVAANSAPIGRYAKEKAQDAYSKVAENLSKDKDAPKKASFEDLSNPESEVYSPAEAYEAIKDDLASDIPETRQTANESLASLEATMTAEREAFERDKGHAEQLLQAMTNEDGSIDPDFEVEHAEKSEQLNLINQRLDQIKGRTLEFEKVKAEHAEILKAASAPNGVAQEVEEAVSAPKQSAQDVVDVVVNHHSQLTTEDLNALADANTAILGDTQGVIFRSLGEVKVEANKVSNQSKVSREVVEGRQGKTIAESMLGTQQYESIVMNGIRSGNTSAVETALDRLQSWTTNYQGKAMAATQVFDTIQSERGLPEKSIDPHKGAQILPDENNNWRIVSDPTQFVPDNILRDMGGLRIHQGTRKLVGDVQREAAHVLNTNNVLSDFVELAGMSTGSIPTPSQTNTAEAVPTANNTSTTQLDNEFVSAVSGNPVSISVVRNTDGDVVEILANSGSGPKAVPMVFQGSDSDVMNQLAQEYPNVLQRTNSGNTPTSSTDSTIDGAVSDPTDTNTIPTNPTTGVEGVGSNQVTPTDLDMPPIEALEQEEGQQGQVDLGDTTDVLEASVGSSTPTSTAPNVISSLNVSDKAKAALVATRKTSDDAGITSTILDMTADGKTPKEIREALKDQALQNFTEAQAVKLIQSVKASAGFPLEALGGSKADQSTWIEDYKANTATRTPQKEVEQKKAATPTKQATPKPKAESKQTPKAEVSETTANGIKYGVVYTLKNALDKVIADFDPKGLEDKALIPLIEQFLEMRKGMKIIVYRDQAQAKAANPKWADGNPAVFDVPSNTVRIIEGSYSEMVTVLAHEMAHGVTLSVRAGKSQLNVSKEVEQGLQEVSAVLQEHLANNGDKLDPQVKDRIEYALSHPMELIAVGIAEKPVRTVLNDLKMPKSKESVFQRLISLAASVFGIEPKNQSAFTRLVELTEKAYSEQFPREFAEWAKGLETPSTTTEVATDKPAPQATKQAEPKKVEPQEEYVPDTSDADVTPLDADIEAALEVEGSLGLKLTGTEVVAEKSKPLGERNILRAHFTQDTTGNNPIVKVKDFVSVLARNVVGVAQKFLPENTRISNAQATHLNDFVDFAKQFNEILLKNHIERPDAYKHQDIAQYLDINDENVRTAMAASAYSWLMENASNTFNEDSAIADLLHLPEGTLIPRTVRDSYKRVGMQQAVVVNGLGSKAYSILQLRADRKSDSRYQSRMEASMGNYVFAALSDLGLVTIRKREMYQHRSALAAVDKVNKTNHLTKYDAMAKEMKLSKSTSYNYVAVTRHAETLDLTPRVEQILTNAKESKGILSKVFSNSIGVQFPSFEKPTEFTQTSIPRTKSKPSSVQAELVKESQTHGFSIREADAKVFETLYESDLDFLHELGGISATDENINKLHISQREDALAAALNAQRVLSNAIEFLDMAKNEDGTYKEFWDTQHLASNSRMHYDASGFNVQGHQTHRVLTGLTSFKTTFPLDDLSVVDADGQPTKLGVVLLSFAENFEDMGDTQLFKDALPNYDSRTFDKVPASDFLPVVLDYVSQPHIVQALDALNKLLDGEKLSLKDKDSIREAVNEGGLGFQSLHALTNMATLVKAIGNGDKEFTTSVGVGSDGINNGVATSNLQSATASQEMLLQTGILPKTKNQEFKTYHDTKKANVPDYYTSFAERMMKGLETQVESLTTLIEESGKSKDADVQKQVKQAQKTLDNIKATQWLFKSFGKRAGAKAWTIPFNYNAGFSKLRTALTNQFISDVYGTMTKIANLTSDPQNKEAYESGMALYEALTKSLQVVGVKEKLPEPSKLNDWDFGMMPSGEIDFMRNWQALEALSDAVEVYGNLTEAATHDAAGDYIVARERDIALHKAAFTVYDFVRSKVTQGFIKEMVAQGKLPANTTLDSYDSLNVEDAQRLNTMLIKYAPFLRSPLSINAENDLEGGIYLADVTQEVSQKDRASTKVKVKGKDTYINTGIRTSSETDRGVGGAALQVQSGDAVVSATTKAKTKAIGVHDADIGSPNNIDMIGKVQNETYTEMMINYDAKGEVFETLLRTLEGLHALKQEYNISDKEIQDLYSKVLGKPETRNRQEVGLATWANSVGLAETTLPSLLVTLGHRSYTADKGRLKILKNTYAIQQYGWEGSAHVMTEADYKRIDARIKEVASKITKLDKVVEQTLNGKGTENVTSEVVANSRQLTSLQKWFGERLGQEITVGEVITEVTKEADALGKVVLRMIAPLIPKHTKVVYFNTGNVPDAAKSLGKGELYNTNGWYNASTSTVYIKSVDAPNSKVNAETLIHELLHGAVAQRLYGALNGSNPKGKQAVDRLNALRTRLGNLEVVKDSEALQNMISNLDEFISYGLSNRQLQDIMRQELVPREERTLGDVAITAFQNFLGNILNILGFSNFRGKQISMLQAFVSDSTVLLSELSGIEPVAITKDFHSTAADSVAKMEALDVYDSLGKGSMSPEHNKFLSDTLGHILGGTYRSDTYAKENFTNVQVGATASDKAGFSQSDRESYASEAIRLAVEFYTDTHADTAMITQMRNLFNAAKSTFKPQDFHEGDWATATVQEKVIANAKYAHMFKTGNGDYLARFTSMALANESVKTLLDVKLKESKTKDKTWFEKAASTLSYVINVVDGKIAGADMSATGSKRAAQLAKSLSELDMRSRQQAVSAIESLNNGLWGLIGKITTPLNKSGGKIIGRTLNNNLFKNSGFKLLRIVGKVAEISTSERLNSLPENIQRLRNEMNPNTRLGEFAEILNEVLTPNALRRVMDSFIRQASALQQVRQNVTDNTKKVILDLFTNSGEHLTKDDHKAITYGLLRTDAQSLLKYRSEQAVLDILGSDAKLRETVNTLTAAIRKANPKHGARMIDQAERLGYYMVTGNGGNGLVKNPKGIADGLGTQSFVKDSGNTVLINQLDQLATLYALSHLSHSNKVKFRNLLKTERDGIRGLLKFHGSQIQQATKDFTGNPYSLNKGYLPDVSNPNREIKHITDPADIPKLERLGWVMIGEVERDPMDKSLTRYLMVHKSKGFQRYVSGAVELQNTSRKGSVVYDNTSPETLKITRGRLNNVPPFSRETAKGLIASYDADGLVLGYSYEMSFSTRDDYLERSNNFADLLGAYEGSLNYKPAKTAQNKEVAKMLHKDFTTNYKRNPKGYIALSPKSTDPKLVEIWRMLPHEFKQEAAALYGKGKPIYVNNSILNATVGFRKYAVSTIWDKQAGERNTVEKVIHALFTGLLGANAQSFAAKGGDLWAGLVTFAKDAIVIRSLSVLVGNVISNLLLLGLSDVRPDQALRDIAYATRHARSYQEARNKIVQLESRKRMGGNLTYLDNEIAQYRDVLNRNPLRDFIEAGMLSTIVEDTMIQQADYTYESATGEKINRAVNKVPHGVRRIGAWALVDPSTPLYQTFATVTQFSDFTAKYSMYKALRAKGVSHEDALVEASESFINYDMPTSRGMQYANDIGLFMFTKFFLRFQHVLTKLLEKKSASVIGQHYAVEYFTDVAGVLDPLFLNRIGNNPFESGAFGVLDAIGSIVTVDTVM